MTDPSFLPAPDGLRIAHRATPGASPTLLFLPGFGSDMAGAKAEHLAALAASLGHATLRLDYTSHGRSDGAPHAGSIGRWLADTLAVIDTTTGPLLAAGSSMGGWIALLAALARPHRFAGLLLIAPAPDFTEDLIWNALDAPARAALLHTGQLARPSDYGPPLPITRHLIEEARRHLLLNAPIPLALPVRLVHGQQDADVPWQRSLTLAERLAATDVRLTLIKDGDHRLSRPQDLALLAGLTREMLASP